MTAVPPVLLFLTLTLCASTGPTHAGRMRALSGLRVEPPEFPMQLRLRWDPPANATASDWDGGDDGGDDGDVDFKYALQILRFRNGHWKKHGCHFIWSPSYTNELFIRGEAGMRAQVSLVAGSADSCSNSSQRHSNWSQLVDIPSPQGLAGSAATRVHCARLTGAAHTMECSWVPGPNASLDTDYSLYYWHDALNGTRRCVPCTHEKLPPTATDGRCFHSGRAAGRGKKAAAAAARKHRKTRTEVTSVAKSNARVATGAATTSLAAGAAGVTGPGGGGKRAWQRCCVPLEDVCAYRSFRIVVNGTSAHHDVMPLYSKLDVENLEKLDPPVNLRMNLSGSSVLAEWDPPPGHQRKGFTCYQTDMRVHDGQRDCQEVSEPKASWLQPGARDCPVTFRVRVRPGRCAGYSGQGLWSEWGPEARVSMGTAVRCTGARGNGGTTGPPMRSTRPDPTGTPDGQGPQSLAWFLASTLIALGVVVLAVVFLSKSQRLRRWFVPWVPDPSRYFKNLFDVHNGDFQAWAGFRTAGKPAAPSAAADGGADAASPAPVCVLSEAVALTGGGGGGGDIGSGTNGYLNLETLCTETALLWQHG